MAATARRTPVQGSGFTAPPRPVPPRQLTSFEMEMLLECFCHYLSGPMRRQLMRDLPALYMLLFPTVSDDTITRSVAARLTEVRGQVSPLPHTDLDTALGGRDA